MKSGNAAPQRSRGEKLNIQKFDLVNKHLKRLSRRPTQNLPRAAQLTEMESNLDKMWRRKLNEPAKELGSKRKQKTREELHPQAVVEAVLLKLPRQHQTPRVAAEAVPLNLLFSN